MSGSFARVSHRFMLTTLDPHWARILWQVISHRILRPPHINRLTTTLRLLPKALGYTTLGQDPAAQTNPSQKEENLDGMGWSCEFTVENEEIFQFF